MNDHLILCVGDKKFVVTADEAFSIANILNGCTTVVNAYHAGSSKRVYGKPELDAAHIVPITGPLQLELETNTRERETK